MPRKSRKNPKPIFFLDLDKLDILENFLNIINKMNYKRYIDNNMNEEAQKLVENTWTLPKGKDIILDYIKNMTKFKLALYTKQSDDVIENLETEYVESYKTVKLLFKTIREYDSSRNIN